MAGLLGAGVFRVRGAGEHVVRIGDNLAKPFLAGGVGSDDGAIRNLRYLGDFNARFSRADGDGLDARLDDRLRGR